MNDMLSIARWLRDERGFSVIALDHPDDPIATDPDQIGKTPIAKWKLFQTARPTDDNLLSWFGNGKRRNVAILTGFLSNVVAVDCDSPEAEAWADEHLPVTLMATRTAKGSHRFYRHPGVPVSNKARIFGNDGLALDVRGDSGYTVAPGSTHYTRSVYARLGPWPPVEDLPVFDLAWLGTPKPEPKLATKARPTEAASTSNRDRLLTRARAYLRTVPGAVEGNGGDQATFVIACRLVRDFGLDEGDALALLREWNQRCSPPWPDRDLEAKIDGALKYGNGPIGSKAIPGSAGDAETSTPAAAEVIANASAALGVLSRGPSRGTRAVRAAQVATRLENREAFSWTDRVLKPLEARQARAEAETLLKPEGELLRGGGEIAQRPSSDAPWDAKGASLIDTLEHPNMIGVEASEQRTADLQRVDILASALDAAVTAKASNSLEKMLCHQMSAAHHAAMRLLGDALGSSDRSRWPPVELARLTNAAARLMDVFQAAFVTLQRARTGGRQEVVVQHVHVAGGGQAVIAGTMKTKRHRGASRGEK